MRLFKNSSSNFINFGNSKPVFTTAVFLKSGMGIFFSKYGARETAKFSK